VQAFVWFTYDTEETAAYAAFHDADEEERVVLNTARGAPQLCAELRDEATASAAAGRSTRAVARVAQAEVLHVNGPPGWVSTIEVLDEVDDDESDDFGDFDDEEDAPDVIEEQRALMALLRLLVATELRSSSCPRSGKLTTR
jgi:hypothetical protein